VNKLENQEIEYMELNIYVDCDEPLKNKYIESSQQHNKRVRESEFPDAGFDMFVPVNINEESQELTIDFKIKCSARIKKSKRPTGFLVYTRSSIYKTPLRLANNVGVIDSGYRGNLMGKFDVQSIVNLQKFERITQIVAHNMIPILVNIVDSIEDLGIATERGMGGFGSTGK
jgi:dUTP pyrophosphatase